MSGIVAMHSRLPAKPALTLNFYAPDSAFAQRLAERLHAHARVQWLDSTQLPPARLAEAGLAGSLLLLDFSEPQLGASANLARQLADQFPDCALVAVGSSSSGTNATSVLAAMRAGVRDFVDVDAPAEDSALLLQNVHVSAKRARQALMPVPKRRARLILLRGVRAGVGTSTLTAHLGALAQQRLQSVPAHDGNPLDVPRVLLLDLGRPAADLSLYLNVEPGYRYEEMLANTARLDATLVRSAFATDRRGVSVVGQAPNTFAAPLGGSEVGALLSRLRGLFDVILCDLGGLPDAQIPVPLLNEADGIWMVTDQSIASLVSLDHALRALDLQRARDARVSLVLNRYHASAGISVQQVASRFDLAVSACIPERLHTLRASAGVGRLLVDDAPKDPYLRALTSLVDGLTPPSTSSTSSAPQRAWRAFTQRLGVERWKIK